MKLNNELLIIDLETTSSQDEDGYQVNNDIIQIGAVLLDRNLDEIDRFTSLVKPREPITEYITNLTGITQDQVDIAPDFLTVANNLIEWASSNVNNIKNIRICAWGTYFDVPILRRQFREYKVNYPFSGTAFDIKTLAMIWMSMSNRRTDKLSVEHVATTMGYQATGAYHDAMVDADMETAILKRIMNDFNSGVFLDGKLFKITDNGFW
jgi:inhibitor of KinA sporulation pathway (predicted exonuclease)